MRYVANLITRTFRVLIAQFGLWLFKKSSMKKLKDNSCNNCNNHYDAFVKKGW